MIRFFYLFIVCIYCNAHQITIDTPHLSISKTKYFLDVSNQLTVEELEFEKFREAKTKSFGHLSDTLWLKFHITSKEEKEYIFDYGTYLIDYLDAYYLKGSKVIKYYKTGNRRDNRAKAILNATFIFPLELKKDETITLLLKIKSSKVVSLHSKISEKYDFRRTTFFKYIYSTAFFTTLIVIMLMHIIIYFITKKSIFKEYILYLCASIGFWFIFMGYISCFIFPNSPLLNNVLFYITVMLYFAFYARYSISLLKFDSYSKDLSLVLKIIAYEVLPLLIAIKLIFIDTYNIYTAAISQIIYICCISILMLISSIFVVSLIKKSRLPKLVSFLWIIKTIVLIIFLTNVKFAYYDFSKFLILIQFFIIIENIFMSILLGYHLKFFEKKNKRLKESYRRNKELSLENLQLMGIENVLNIIIHQWKQPLNILNSITLNIETKFNKGALEKEFLLGQLNEIEKQTDYMNDTLNNFFNYLRVKKRTETFSLYDTLIESVNLISNNLLFKNIDYMIYCKDKDLITSGYKKEYIQTILILINNSIEAFENSSKPNKWIKFFIYQNRDGLATFVIKDNAGGIKIEPIEAIFKAQISNKKNKNSGFGLFIAKNLIENMRKTISCKDLKDGSKFKIIG